MKKTALLMGAILLGSLPLASSAHEETSATSVVSSISLKAVEGPYVAWTTQGTSVNGFKVVWSKNSGPVYPNRDGDRYHYLSDSSASKDKLEPFAGAGTYYVRVCEYLGGKCGTYSNEVTLSLAGEAQKPEKEMKEKMGESLSKEYEKIPNLDAIRLYTNIKKVGNDLYGIKIESILANSKKEKITSLADIRYFKNIEKIGDSLYGIRIEDGRKIALQNKLNALNEQMKRLQAQIEEINKQLSSLQ